MGIGSLVKDLGVALVGNRVNLAGISLAAYGVSNIDFSRSFADQNSFHLYASFFGLSLIIETCAGIGTLRSYRRAKKHLSRFGRVDVRYLRKHLVDDALCGEPSAIAGSMNYCVPQGIYLAARELGLEESFREANSKIRSSPMPHF